MKLVVIYGPPAVGKLTVAKELAKMTGYGIFHNHSTIDITEPLFKKFGTKRFWHFNEKLRLDLIEMAAKENINGLIFTLCCNKESNPFIKKLIRRIKKHQGTVCFSQLVCSKDALYRRVRHSSREDFGKIKNVKKLKEYLNEKDFFSQVPNTKTYSIDNTRLSAKKVALMIKRHYNL